MINTTLCYIEQDGKYLMMLRNKKENDVNEGKMIGVGGKFEPGETADECLLREVKEETGLTLTEYHFYGVIQFHNTKYEYEDMYLYSATGFTGTLNETCREGEFAWIPKEKMMEINTWAGDYIFLQKMLDGEASINLTLNYEGDELVSVVDRGNNA